MHQIWSGIAPCRAVNGFFPRARVRHVWPPVALAYGLPTCRGGGRRGTLLAPARQAMPGGRGAPSTCAAPGVST